MKKLLAHLLLVAALALAGLAHAQDKAAPTAEAKPAAEAAKPADAPASSGQARA